MIELINNYFIELNNSIVVICSIIALIFYNKYRNTEVRFFIYYLIYVAFILVLGGYTWYVFKYESLHFIRDALNGTLIERNYWWFNIFWTLGSAVFLSFYYNKILKYKLFKIIVKVMGALLITTFVTYLIFDLQALFRAKMSPFSILGSLVILTCIVLYFVEILKSERILNFMYSFNFIASFTLFIWFLIVTPIVFFDLYFNTSDWNFVFLRQHIFFFSNLFMYGMFSFAFVWCKPDYDLQSYS